jgi:flagellar biosynthesis protein FliQ
LVSLSEHALVLVVALSLPIVLSAAVASIFVGIFQAFTQIHDAVLSHLARLIAVAIALSIGGPWIGSELTTFARQLLGG